MKRKTPITDWQTGTEILNDIEISYVAKSISYDLDGICLFVGRRKDNPTPVEFYYFLELDIDLTQAATISFLKRGLLQIGFDFTLPPQKSNQGPYIAKFPNVITIPPIGYTLNLFEAHIHSDTIVFNYTAQNGTKKEFRFSLAGFNEKYLEQFI